MEERKPIFFDERQRRWARTRRTLEIVGILFTILLTTFLVSVVRAPEFPSLSLLLPKFRPALHALREKRRPKPVVMRTGRRKRVAALGSVPSSYDPLRAAFYVSWDPSSFASLRQHYRDLDILIPESLHAISPDGQLQVEVDTKLASWMQSLGVEIPTMALVNNSDGKVWHTQEMAEFLAHPESRERLVRELLEFARNKKQAGLVVDFEEVPDGSQEHFRTFARELAAAMHGAQLKLMVALPAANPSYDYAHFAANSDAIILMNYDQHWPTSAPGPIASQDWYLRNLKATLDLVPPEKLVVGIANYAYDWEVSRRRGTAARAASVSFQEAVVRALESEAIVDFDADSLNPHFSYADDKEHVHRVWMLDGVTAYNQLRAAERRGVRGTAMWRLGSEDPSLWTIWDATRPDDSIRARLNDMPPGYDLILEGDGDLWRINSTPQAGRRAFRYDFPTDTIVDEEIQVIPVSYRIDQIGATRGKIALTFDDGPDPKFTPRVLDILQREGVPATFFVTGIAANGSPGLLARIYDSGHEIGNHTYTHPRFDQISRAQLRLELNLTERLLESTLGIKSLMFRPPYGVDHQPESADEIELLPVAQNLGFVIVGSKIDPHDWGEVGGRPPPSPELIATRVIELARAGKGNVALLHDGGGDRQRTIEALPLIISGLRKEGFELVRVSALLGRTRDQVMPPMAPNERWLARADAFVFNLYHLLRLFIAGVFVVGIVLVSGRALIIGLLALVEKLRAQPAPAPAFRPMVSVLIPAYNEEEVIEATVQSALGSDYAELEVIVVDDGSTDGTSERLRERFAGDPRLKLFGQSNRGKSAALNRARVEASGEVLVTLDADTCVDPSAVGLLVRHFANPKIGAVAGNVKVANRHRWLTRWQALEYITSQNLEKRAFDLLNCISVVPGALGAWRADAVRAAGGFSSDTVAEDTDLTLAIRRRGWRILYDEQAIARTQAPETVGALLVQRFRWTFGTMQAVWKHRDTLGRARYGTLGWVALPNVFVFQILLPLFSPAIDLLFLSSLLLWGLAQLHISPVQVWTTEDVERALVFFAGFLLIDVLTCVIAFVLEKKEDWSLLSPLVLQRFYYRQLMYVVLFRSLVRAVQGHAVGWGGMGPALPTPAARA